MLLLDQATEDLDLTLALSWYHGFLYTVNFLANEDDNIFSV